MVFFSVILKFSNATFFFSKKNTFIAVEKKFPQFFPYKVSQSNEKLPQNKWLDLSRYNHS